LIINENYVLLAGLKLVGLGFAAITIWALGVKKPQLPIGLG